MRRMLRIAALLSATSLAAQEPRIVRGAKIDSSKSINFASGIWPSAVYVGQQATYEIGIFLDEEVRSRLRRNPEFIPPDVRSMLAVDLPVARQLYSRREGTRQYDVHVFSRAMFPLQPGRQIIGSARLNYAVPLSSSIFSLEESHTARATEHAIEVREPPVDGRPADFRGAVGRLTLTSRVDATRTRVGDPVTLTVTVSGVGSMPLLPRPVVTIPWAQVVNGPERLNIDSASTLIGGSKQFDFVVTPREQGVRDVPEMRYTYFNPYTEQYEAAIAPAVGLRVDPGSVVAASTVAQDTPARLSIRTKYRGETSAPWATLPVFWFGALLAPLPALFFASRRRRKGRPIASPASRLRDIAADPRAAPHDVRHAFVHAVTDRVPLVELTIIDPSRFERHLRREGVSRSAAQDASRLLQSLNEASFSPAPGVSSGLGAQALHVHSVIDAEAIQRRKPADPKSVRKIDRAGVVISMLLAGSLLGASAFAQMQARASQFDAAVERYAQNDLSGAREVFRQLAQLESRAADSWANFGTASWELGDSVAAAAGWQRALRLEPMASDVRDRLSGTPGFTNGWFGDVPPLPPNVGAGLALFTWLVACGSYLLYVRQRDVRWQQSASGAFATSVVLGLATLISAERARGQDRSLVKEALVVYELPALSASTTAQAVVGEQVRVIAHEGGWDRVSFSDGREGWVEGSLLQSLEVPAAR